VRLRKGVRVQMWGKRWVERSRSVRKMKAGGGVRRGCRASTHVDTPILENSENQQREMPLLLLLFHYFH